MYYLDTSVLVALYIPEINSSKIQDFITGKAKMSISPLSKIEFNSAVSRRVRMKDISRADGIRIISFFQLHIKERIYQSFPILQREYELAQSWIGSFDTALRSLDALHLAVAFTNKLELVTSDIILAKAAADLGIKITEI
ncbi:MAG: type II toxin-antitoxin system VapC family toxin [Spirochaetales bacterium]|nr:type II toxin-antitoxin system VapC family toxin [Spirochaetales bacterium]